MSVKVERSRPRVPAAAEQPVFMSIVPSWRLLRAAMSGLLTAGAAGCSDDKSDANTKSSTDDLSDKELQALCADMIDKAVDAKKCDAPDADALCADMVKDAEKSAQEDADKTCADTMKTCTDDAAMCTDNLKALTTQCQPLLGTSEEKTISSEQKEYTFKELRTECDKRGGYTQVQAACGSENVCAGFSYADWGPDGATFTEHSCAGANACNGLSCIVLPKDGGKKGDEVYKAEYDEPGPNACTSCHAVPAEKEGDDPDVTKFQLWLHADSTRTKDNWLDRPAAEQEQTVAFGVHGVEPGGIGYQTMAPYHKFLSRKEIERVVKHIRTLDVVIKQIKVADE